jgi:hypothetical protein
MRCVACGTEMRFVRVVPYEIMVSARELHMFECPSCRRTERQLVFTHNIEPLPSERMQLPSVSSPVLTAAMHKVSVAAQNAWMSIAPTFRDGFSSAAALLTSATHKVSAASQNAWVCTTAMFRGSLPSASSALLTSVQHNVSVARHKVSVAARSAWARTVAMFRGSQDEGL